MIWKKSIILLSGLLLIALINMLSVGLLSSSPSASNRDIVFLVDLTLSMNAVDGRDGNESTRIDNVREDMLQIAQDNEGAALGIFTFSSDTEFYSPLSVNSNDFKEAVETLYTAPTLNSVASVVKYSDTFTKLEDYLKKQNEVDPTRERVVIVMSDFEVFNDQEPTEEIVNSSKKLKNYAGGLANIVYGKDEGSKILIMGYDHITGENKPWYKIKDSAYDSYTDEDVKEIGFDPDKFMSSASTGDYVAVLSKPNFSLAENIAKTNGGKTIRYTDKSQYKKTIDSVSRSAAKSAASSEQSKALRQNWLYSPIALLLFIWLAISELARPAWLKSFFTKRKSKK